MVMLGLLHILWPCQQLLVALCGPNTH